MSSRTRLIALAIAAAFAAPAFAHDPVAPVGYQIPGEKRLATLSAAERAQFTENARSIYLDPAWLAGLDKASADNALVAVVKRSPASTLSLAMKRSSDVEKRLAEVGAELNRLKAEREKSQQELNAIQRKQGPNTAVVAEALAATLKKLY